MPVEVLTVLAINWLLLLGVAAWLMRKDADLDESLRRRSE